jgi:MarR family transcriptional regulator, transcriptional regulator for hemolysin
VSAAGESLSSLVSATAKTVSRAFDDVLVAAGGSTATWQVLRALQSGDHSSQSALAEVVGIRQPTLSHHLDALERAGLVRRERMPGNRRVQRVTVTESGAALFLRLRRAAGAFDGRLRAGLDDAEVAELTRLLGQLAENAPPD